MPNSVAIVSIVTDLTPYRKYNSVPFSSILHFMLFLLFKIKSTKLRKLLSTTKFFVLFLDYRFGEMMSGRKITDQNHPVNERYQIHPKDGPNRYVAKSLPLNPNVPIQSIGVFVRWVIQ